MDAERQLSAAATAARAALAGCEKSPGATKPDPILVADSVRRTFGGITAVDVDHLEGVVVLEAGVAPPEAAVAAAGGERRTTAAEEAGERRRQLAHGAAALCPARRERPRG